MLVQLDFAVVDYSVTCYSSFLPLIYPHTRQVNECSSLLIPEARDFFLLELEICTRSLFPNIIEMIPGSYETSSELFIGTPLLVTSYGTDLLF